MKDRLFFFLFLNKSLGGQSTNKLCSVQVKLQIYPNWVIYCRTTRFSSSPNGENPMPKIILTVCLWFVLSHPQILNNPLVVSIALLVQITADISTIQANRSNLLIAKRKRRNSHKNSWDLRQVKPPK